jgi:hypothetical protein
MMTVSKVECEVSMPAAEVMAAEVTTDVDVDVTAAVVGDVMVDVDVMAAVMATTVMTATVATGRSGCGHDDGGSDRSSGSKREHGETIQHGEAPSEFSFLQPALGRRVCSAYFARARAIVPFVTRVTAFLRMLKHQRVLGTPATHHARR